MLGRKVAELEATQARAQDHMILDEGEELDLEQRTLAMVSRGGSRAPTNSSPQCKNGSEKGALSCTFSLPY